MAKAQTARRKRLKELYALLYKHELDADHRTHVYQNHFQDGDGAFQYLIAVMRTPIDRLQLRELDDKWTRLDILQDVGVQENTILLITTKIKAANAKRPIANHKTQTECTERLLECIFTTSTAAPAEEAVAARGEPRRQERPKRQPSGAKGRNKG